MDYKKFIKSRKLRIQILNLLSWIPDKWMVTLQYYIHTGHKINFKNPERFSEKLQLYKLFYRDRLMRECTDKYEVRRVIKDMGLNDILIPLIGVYDNPSDIDFNSLPDEFVAKTTDGGGGNQVLICKDKTILGKEAFFNRINIWMNAQNWNSVGREWAYNNGYPRRIIIEQLLKVPDNGDLPDYKFFCFNGKVGMVYGISQRRIGSHAQFGIYTPDFEKLPVSRCDERMQDTALPKPYNYQKMVEIAERISSHFPHVRVDLYNIDGKIYFGELTFYDGSGYMTFNPDSFDIELGSKFNVKQFMK